MSVANFQVVFPRPGFFITDIGITVLLDQRLLYQGSFMAGFERVQQVELGAHTIDTIIDLGALSRKRNYTFTLGSPTDYRATPPMFRATLQYSRFWGNFTKKLTVEQLG